MLARISQTVGAADVHICTYKFIFLVYRRLVSMGVSGEVNQFNSQNELFVSVKTVFGTGRVKNSELLSLPLQGKVVIFTA